MAKRVDSYRFVGGISKRLVKSWIGMERPREVPWTQLAKPLSECKVALISSAGLALVSDRPFDQEGERRNPWWGDPSYRRLPGTVTEAEVRLCHLHVDPSHAARDLNCLFPVARLNALAAAGVVGSAASTHYSIMGYILHPETLLQETAPAIIRDLKADRADVVVLVPA